MPTNSLFFTAFSWDLLRFSIWVPFSVSCCFCLFFVVVVFVTVLLHRVAKMTHPLLHGRPVSTKSRDFFSLNFLLEIIFFFQANKPVVVTLGATLQQIQKVDAKEGTLTIMVW